MSEAKVTINNKVGLHARPVAMLVSEAAKFKSDIIIKKGEKEANLKSLLAVLSLGVSGGEEIIIKVNGEDESEALEAVLSTIKKLDD